MRQPSGSIWAPRPARARVPTPARTVDPPHHRPHGRHGLSAEQESILELQRLAGNAAVTRALADGRAAGLVTTVDSMDLTREGMPPDKGVEQIREKTANKLTLALTQRGIGPYPPIMRPLAPEQVKDGYVARTQKVGSIPEPQVKEYWPKEGRHKLPGNSYLDVDPGWEEKLRDGEDEHGRDAKVAWELTWKLVQDTINRFADKAGPPAATPEAATKALWRRYVNALPKELQPAGEMPTEARQREVLDVKPGTFFAWMWEATVARDQRMNHSTKAVPAMSPKNPPKGAVVSTIDRLPDFKVPGKTSEDFIAELRAKWEPGKIIIGSKLKAGDETGKDG